eukprot:g3219.t1
MEISDEPWSLNSNDIVESESESVNSSRQKRRKLETVMIPPRPDNEMTRKLRPQKLPLSQVSHVPTPPPPPPVRFVKPVTDSSSSSIELVRELAPGQEQEDIELVRRMWEMPVVFDFLMLFNDRLEIVESISMDEIEKAIVVSNGQGFLGHLHTELLKGFRPKLKVNKMNWTVILAKKFRTEELNENPFRPSSGSEAEDYCNATVTNRVRILKLLCEMRCCEHDLRNILQDVLKPIPKPSSMSRKRKMKDRITINHYRRVPIGRLSSTILFWLVEIWDPVQVRLYKEVLQSPKKNERISGQTKVQSWELIASSYEELSSFADSLGIKGTHSRNLKKRISNEVLPDLERELEREAKKQRRAERIKANASTIILDQHGGYGRSIRSRTEAKYTFEEYDRTMDEAIDEGEPWNSRLLSSDKMELASPHSETNSLNQMPNAFVSNGNNATATVQNNLQENDSDRMDA